MTLPIQRESLSVESDPATQSRLARLEAAWRTRRIAAVIVVVGLAATAGLAVLMIPALAAPIGTAAGVAAVALPLAQGIWKATTPGRGLADRETP